MVSSPTSQPPDEVVKRGYETTHISIAALLMTLIGLALGGVLLGIGVWHVEKQDLRDAARADRPASFIHTPPNLNGAPPLQPDGPAHDTTPPEDLAAMRASENAVFDHMGWRNPQTGAIDVPDAITSQVITHFNSTTRPAP